MFNIVVAMDKNQGIGKNRQLPWPKLKGDMKFYRELTCSTQTDEIEERYGLTGNSNNTYADYQEFLDYLKSLSPPSSADIHPKNAVIMGRKTWDSLPERFRPLPNRLNIVLTRRKSLSYFRGSYIADCFEDALAYSVNERCPNTFVIGGSQIYNDALRHGGCDKIYITKINTIFKCDTFFPEIGNSLGNEISGFSVYEDSISYQFTVIRFKAYDSK